MTKIIAKLKEVLSFLLKTKQFITPTYIHNKSKDKSLKTQVKISSVILQVCSNEAYLQKQLRNLSSVLWNSFVAEPIFKIGSLNLFSAEPTFRFRKCWNFETWISSLYVVLWNQVFKCS